MEKAEQKSVSDANIQSIIFLLFILILLFVFIIFLSRVEHSEAIRILDNILHGSQSVLDLALQICMHKKRGNNARNEDRETFGSKNLMLITIELHIN